MDLAKILRTGEVPPEIRTTPSPLTGVPTTEEETPAGVKRIGNLIVAGAIKMLEIILPIYGVESEEGRRIKRAISNLSPLSKGITTEDLLSFLKMLGEMLTASPSLISPTTSPTSPTLGAGGGSPIEIVRPTSPVGEIGTTETVPLETLLRRTEETTK